MIQGTQEWYDARNGRVTASCFDLLTEKRGGGGFGQAAMSYCYKLLSERLHGFAQREVIGPALDWGRSKESFARAAYQYEHPSNVSEVGYVPHPTIPNVGGSPDGVIRDQNKIIEIKCPYYTDNHLETIDTQQVPKQYMAQVQGNLWVTGYESCDYISFDDRLKEEHLHLCVINVPRDEKYIEKLAARVAEFAAMVDSIERKLRNGKAA